MRSARSAARSPVRCAHQCPDSKSSRGQNALLGSDLLTQTISEAAGALCRGLRLCTEEPRAAGLAQHKRRTDSCNIWGRLPSSLDNSCASQLARMRPPAPRSKSLLQQQLTQQAQLAGQAPAAAAAEQGEAGKGTELWEPRLAGAAHSWPGAAGSTGESTAASQPADWSSFYDCKEDLALPGRGATFRYAGGDAATARAAQSYHLVSAGYTVLASRGLCSSSFTAAATRA